MQVPANEPNPVQSLLERAELLLDLDRPGEAVPLLQQAISLAPEDCNPQCWMALALFRLGRHADALRAAERGAALAPDYEWPHRLRSIILRDQRKFRPALEAAQVAVRLAPDEENALHLLATSQFDCKQFTEAHDTALRLREVAPEWDSTHTLLGNIAIQFKRWEEAEEHCRRALELNPEAKNPLHNLGYLCQRAGRKQEAADYYHAVLRLDPKDEQARRALLSLVSRDMAELPIWLRKKRLEQEHPTVQAFVTDAHQRTQREANHVLAVGWVILGWVISLGWSLFVLGFLVHGDLNYRWWDWLAYLSVVLGTLAGTAYLVWKKRTGAR